MSPQLRNTETHWGTVAITLHWLVVILIIGQLILAGVADDMPNSPAKFDIFVWHKSLGLTVLLLVLARICWRLANPTPALPADTPPRERTLARLSHGLLYALLIAVPISGWIIADTSKIPFKLFFSIPTPDLVAANPGLHEAAEEAHEVLVTVLLVVAGIHLLAALRHHFIKHDDVLRRMLPW